MTDLEKNNLKKGDLIICPKQPNIYQLAPNNVVTFSNWYEEVDGKWYLQIKEFFNQGNSVHNLPYNEFEVFDKEKFPDFIMVTPEILKENKKLWPFL